MTDQYALAPEVIEATGVKDAARLIRDHAGAGLVRSYAPSQDGGAGLVTTGALAVDDRGHVVDRAEQQQAHEAATKPEDCLLGWKMRRQHPPFTA